MDMTHLSPVRAAKGKEWRKTRWVERGLLLLGLVCLSIWAWDVSAAQIYQAAAGQRLDELIRRSGRWRRGWPADPARREPWRQEVGDPIGRIEIPRIGLSAIIAEGVDPETLQLAVGHVPATALPGQSGNVVLAGHRDSFFRRLGSSCTRNRWAVQETVTLAASARGDSAPIGRAIPSRCVFDA